MLNGANPTLGRYVYRPLGSFKANLPIAGECLGRYSILRLSVDAAIPSSFLGVQRCWRIQCRPWLEVPRQSFSHLRWVKCRQGHWLLWKLVHSVPECPPVIAQQVLVWPLVSGLPGGAGNHLDRSYFLPVLRKLESEGPKGQNRK
jgi:hypothetical protein